MKMRPDFNKAEWAFMLIFFSKTNTKDESSSYLQ